MRKSVLITRFGSPEVLKLSELDSEKLRTGHVRIQVRASGVNFADLMMRMGMYPEAPKPPFTPGYEVAGVITEIGPDVQGFSKGDRVFAGCKFGGYTTEIVLPAHAVRKIPARLSDAEAASIPVNFLTAWIALEEMGRVRMGDRVLVHSAAGGVGVAAVQIAARAGARVIGLVGSPVKADAVKALGASEVLTNEEWEKRSDREFERFDLILDAVGGESLKRSFRRLAPTGRVVNFGVSSMIGGQKRSLVRAASMFVHMPWYSPLKLMMENKGVFGLNLLQLFNPPQAGEPDRLGRSFDKIIEGFEEGKFKAVVGKTFPLAEAGAAQTHLMSRSNIGKVVLDTY